MIHFTLKGVDSILKIYRHRRDDWQIRMSSRKTPLRVIIVGGGYLHTGWVQTDIEHLNLLKKRLMQRKYKCN